jgi:dienelactone hydrolase
MKMSRWVRSGTVLAVVVVLVAALAAIAMIHTAGFGRADVCADADGRQLPAVGGCIDAGAGAPFALPPPEFVSPPLALPPPEFVSPPLLPENRRHPDIARAWSTKDLGSGDPLPSGPGWEVGNYKSTPLNGDQSYQIYGLICYPASQGPHPVLMLNHGVWGIGAAQVNGCINLAANGWLVATSTYRGEPINGLPSPYTSFMAQSKGLFEFCGGEVGDMLDLLAIVKALPNANPNQVADQNKVVMYGHSLGSCVTELAIERGAAPQIAVSVDGPTDFTRSSAGGVWQGPNTETWGDVVADGAIFQVGGTAWCLSCGPGPQSDPAQQQIQLTTRSSALSTNNNPINNNPQALANPNVKFLRIHSQGDLLVLPENGCELAAALPPGGSNYYYHLPDLGGNTGPGTFDWPPKECDPRPNPCINNGPHDNPPDVVNCGPWKLEQLTPNLYYPPWRTPAHPYTPSQDPWAFWNTPTFLIYSCPKIPLNPPVQETGCPMGPTVPTLAEHADIVPQSWPEVVSFVNQFANGWSAQFPSQFPFM